MLPYDGTADCLVCHDGTQYPPEYEQDRLPALLGLLTKIHDTCGGFQIISGYRSPAYNQKLAKNSAAHQVASGSQHVEGRAADIRPVNGTVQELYSAIMSMVSFGDLEELGGIGLYPVSNWVHVDTRPKEPPGHVAKWSGT